MTLRFSACGRLNWEAFYRVASALQVPPSTIGRVLHRRGKTCRPPPGILSIASFARCVATTPLMTASASEARHPAGYAVTLLQRIESMLNAADRHE